MIGVEAARKLASNLPDVTVGRRHGNCTWFVGTKGFAWERPFSKADVRRFGDVPPPSGPIFAVRVADLQAKEAVLAARMRGVFTIPHFDGYAAVLIQLDVVSARDLKQLVTDAWLSCVPPSITAQGRVQPRSKRSTRKGPSRKRPNSK
jgi:hypothetical protein